MPSSRERRSPAGAWVEGATRVLRAPAVVLGVAAATLLLALPLSLAVRDMLAGHLGASATAERAAAGWDAGWVAEFGAQAQGLGRTFTHEILGFGGTVSTLSGLLDGRPLPPTVVGAVAAYLLLWLFLSGGILDRFARARPIRTAAFFAACGVHFWRFLRLGLLLAPLYWAVFAWLHPWLFTTLWNRWTRDLTIERDAILIRLALYAVLLAALTLINLVSDYAKVRTVVEDRRSMLGAAGAACRFIRRRPLRTLGLYLLSALAAALVIHLWSHAAPAATTPVAWAFLVTQLYVLLRLWTRLTWMAGEVVFFQRELAHASYTAAPLPVWPDSPAAEALQNLTARR